MIRDLVMLASGLCLLWPAGAAANAWQREAGTGFASLATRMSWPMPIEDTTQGNLMGTAFVEYGLSERFSLGLDLSQSEGGDRKAVLFLQTPLLAGDGAHRVAVELGIGEVAEELVVRPGLSYGFGFSQGAGGGWLSIDATAALSMQSDTRTYALDMTYGLSTERGMKYIFQVQSGKAGEAAAFARIAPSLVVPWGDSRNVELGVTYGVRGDTDLGVKLGLWQKF